VKANFEGNSNVSNSNNSSNQSKCLEPTARNKKGCYEQQAENGKMRMRKKQPQNLHECTQKQYLYRNVYENKNN
jgi:hypothetical protein